MGSIRTYPTGCCIVNEAIAAPEAWGIIKVLVYVVGMRSSSEFDSGATGETATPCCPGCTTIVSSSAAGNGLLDPLGAILMRGMQGETSAGVGLRIK